MTLFLDSFDFASGDATFYQASEEILARQCVRARNSTPIRTPIANLLASERFLRPERPVHFIWMTDFCGSTLLANALRAFGGVSLFNETFLFAGLANARRSLADDPAQLARWEKLLQIAVYFQGQTFRPGDVSLVKEWPLSNLILREMLQVHEASRGLFLYAPLEEYLSACLKDRDRRRLARERVTTGFSEIARLAPLRTIDTRRLTDAEAAALHWLTLMMVHQRGCYGEIAQLVSVHNGDLFEHPFETLLACARHLELDVSAASVRAVLDGPVFRQHSKDPDHPFDVTDHRAALSAARKQYAREIEVGLRFAADILAVCPVPDRLPPALAI